MDSNEEYLDQLLKSLTEDNSSAPRGMDDLDDVDDGIEDLLNQFSDDMHNVPEELISGLLGGSDNSLGSAASEMPEAVEELSGEADGAPELSAGQLFEESSGTSEEATEELFSELEGMPETAEELSGEEAGQLLDETAGMSEMSDGELSDESEGIPEMSSGGLSDGLESLSEMSVGELSDESEGISEMSSGELSDGLEGLSELSAGEQPEDLEGLAEMSSGELSDGLESLSELLGGEQPEESEGIPEMPANEPSEESEELAVGELSDELVDMLEESAEELPDESPLDLDSILNDMSGELEDDTDESVQETPNDAIYDTADSSEASDDLSSLLDSLSAEGDEDVQEISDLLAKADNDEPIADMMDSLFQEMSDDAEEQPRRKKRKKKERVKKEKKSRRRGKKQGIQDIADSLPKEDAEEQIDEVQQQMDAILSAEETQGKKKQGFFGKLANVLFQEEEETEDPADLISDENGAIMEQLDKEEQKKSKGKKKKTDKKGKGKKAGNTEEEDEFDEEASDTGKKKKVKKPKKEKPPVSVEELLPGPKLSIRKALPIVIVALTCCAAFVMISHLYINHVNKTQAENAYYAGDYLKCYELLFGQDMNESQSVMFHKSELILQMERAKGNYLRLVLEEKKLEALDYLVQFIGNKEAVYQKGLEWGCLDTVEETYLGMLSLLRTNYGLEEEQALEIVALKKDIDYTVALMEVLEGFDNAEANAEGEDQQSPYEDLLPEEEEISDTSFVDSVE
ncbi:MAG: hypothetical protein NC543_11405 [bacterium]|nr:hypothetical protein [bacterium]MCM1375873.1 hypothetical protein [Muribaculum sp.]